MSSGVRLYVGVWDADKCSGALTAWARNCVVLQCLLILCFLVVPCRVDLTLRQRKAGPSLQSLEEGQVGGERCFVLLQIPLLAKL